MTERENALRSPSCPPSGVNGSSDTKAADTRIKVTGALVAPRELHRIRGDATAVHFTMTVRVVESVHREAQQVSLEGERALEVGDGRDRADTADSEIGHQLCDMPASATSICPVTQPASSERRKATAGAMSAA